MTCKDCIHSELCYKKNEYDNFPDRCGSFIEADILSQGDLIKPLTELCDRYCKFCPIIGAPNGNDCTDCICTHIREIINHN